MSRGLHPTLQSTRSNCQALISEPEPVHPAVEAPYSTAAASISRFESTGFSLRSLYFGLRTQGIPVSNLLVQSPELSIRLWNPVGSRSEFRDSGLEALDSKSESTGFRFRNEGFAVGTRGFETGIGGCRSRNAGFEVRKDWVQTLNREIRTWREMALKDDHATSALAWVTRLRPFPLDL